MTWHYDVIFLALSYPITFFSLGFRFRWAPFHFASDSLFPLDRLHKCLTVEPTSVLVMGNGTSTASSRKHSSSRRTRAHRQHGYSFLQQLLRACARSNTSWSTSQLIQTLSGLCGGRSCMSPQGTTVGSINVTTSASATGMYEPNQFVMNCGIADPTAGPIRFSSPVARNLNDGDAIALVVRHTNSAARTVMGTCRYAITLQ